MKVLVTGSAGQLGYDVCKVLASRQIENRGVDITDFDITDQNAVNRYLKAYRPDAVIHCSAWTAVDKAEDEPERVEAVNADGTRNIAEACKKIGAKMLYLSTDYVFPGTGDRFYEPNDPTGPLSVYGRTKLAGELAVRKLLEKYFIVRISWVFGKNGNNFVKTMLRLAETHTEVNVVCDQIGSPTYTADLAPAALRYDRHREIRRIPRDERRPLFLGRICRGNFPCVGKTGQGPCHSHRTVSHKSNPAEKFADEQSLPGSCRISSFAGLERRVGEILEGAFAGMNQKTVRKGCGITLAVYLVLAVLLYWIGGDQFHYRDEQTDMLTASTPIGEMTKDQVVTQKISISGDELRGISFMGATYGRQNTGTLLIEVLEDGQLLGSASVDVSALQDNSEFSVSFSPAFSVPSGEAELRITAPESEPGNAVTLYVGNTMSATGVEVPVAIAEDEYAFVNGTPLSGSLCLSLQRAISE